MSSRSKTLTVSTLTMLLKEELGSVFGNVVVEGELSNFTAHRSGHWYFSVKDDQSVLNCVMFRGDNRHVLDQPVPGDMLQLTGGIDVYVPQGRYNLLVRKLQQAGAGDLARQFEELKRRLAEAGLFAPELKKPLPALPAVIGIATSPTGAALHDMLRIIDERLPGRHIIFAPCQVQGADAPRSILQALKRLEADGRAEVVICGRGGGSPEDLAAFNDEGVALFISSMSTPVVSAVGHEPDVSISDLVADVRAATPSHAAELVVPERAGLLAMVDDLETMLGRCMRQFLEARSTRLSALVPRSPHQRVDEGRMRLDDLADKINRSTSMGLEKHRTSLGVLGGRLDALSPLAVLDRGYSVVHKKAGIVRSVGDVSSGDAVSLRFADGMVGARID